MAGWLVGWLAGLAGWLVGWLAGLAGWQKVRIWLVGWLAGLVGWLAKVEEFGFDIQKRSYQKP